MGGGDVRWRVRVHEHCAHADVRFTLSPWRWQVEVVCVWSVSLTGLPGWARPARAAAVTMAMLARARIITLLLLQRSARARANTHTHTHTTRVPCIASPCCIGKVLLPARPARPAVTYPRSAWLANQLSAAAADAASDGGGGGGEEDGGSRSAEASEGAAATAAERGYAALAAAADWSPQWGTAAGEQEGRVQVCRSALQRKLRPLGSVVGAAFLLVKFPELHP